MLLSEATAEDQVSVHSEIEDRCETVMDLSNFSSCFNERTSAGGALKSAPAVGKSLYPPAPLVDGEENSRPGEAWLMYN